MAITQGSPIVAGEINTYVNAKDLITSMDYNYVASKLFETLYTQHDHYQWVRYVPGDNPPEVAWDAGTTYIVDDLVSFEDVNWKSTSAGNILNEPSLGSIYWDYVGSTSQTYNFTVKTGNYKPDTDILFDNGVTYRYTINTVTWDINDDEVLTPFVTVGWGYLNTTRSYALPPGYYKFEGESRTGGAVITNGAYMHTDVRPWDNQLTKGDRLRVMASTFEGLSDNFGTKIVAKIATDGYMSSVNYLGGNAPTWTGD